MCLGQGFPLWCSLSSVPICSCCLRFSPHFLAWKTFLWLKTEAPIEVKKATFSLSSVTGPPSAQANPHFVFHPPPQDYATQFWHLCCFSSAPCGFAVSSCSSYRFETLSMSPASHVCCSFYPLVLGNRWSLGGSICQFPTLVSRDSSSNNL